MSGSLNKVILIGNVGSDPEIKRNQSGGTIGSFRLATSETWRDKNTGERKEKTEWHRVVSFNENINKVLEQYVKKGAKLYVEGSLQTRKWTDQSGADRYSTEVVLNGFSSTLTMLDGRRDGNAGNQSNDESSGQDSYYSRKAAEQAGGGMPDDDLPF